MPFKYEKPLYRPNKKRSTKASRSKAAKARIATASVKNRRLGYSTSPQRTYAAADILPKESPVSDAERAKLARQAAKAEKDRKERIRQYQIDKAYELANHEFAI